MSTDPEQYLLLLLSDSNLPTGGFIASSGLESHIQHGFLLSSPGESKPDGVLAFIRSSLSTYAHLQLPFFSAAHRAVATLTGSPPSSETLAAAIAHLQALDSELEATTLNHIARRASTAQGVALLTLYQRSFALEEDANVVAELVAALRTAIRTGTMNGHQTIGFAVLAAGLGVSLPAAIHLFLFLHARSLLSSAVRLNTVGPYVSHRLLLHDIQPLVAEAIAGYERGKGDGSWEDDGGESGPATTWPLGEIVAARHDLLHTKIFNS